MPKLTREQVESMKAKAVRFVQNVLEDDERASEIEDESPEEYAERKRITIINPQRTTAMAQTAATKADLERRIAELEEENDALQDRLDTIVDVAAADEDEDDEDDEDEDEEDE